MHGKQYLPCSIVRPWRIFSWALGCHPLTGEVKPVIITQTCREKWGVSHQLFCSELNSRFKRRLFLVRIGCLTTIKPEVVLFSYSNADSYININKTSKADFDMYILYVQYMSVCSGLWAVSQWFKQDRLKVDIGKLVRKNDKWEVNDSRTPGEGVWFLSSRSYGQFN